jgi:hypothetical protein
LKEKTKSKRSRVQNRTSSKGKVTLVPAARWMLGLLTSVIESVDEVADAEDEVWPARAGNMLSPLVWKRLDLLDFKKKDRGRL